MVVADSYLGADIYLLTAAFEFIFFWNLPYLDFGFVFTSVVLMLVLMLVLMKVLVLVLKLAPMLVLAGTDAGDVGGVPEIRCPVIINKTHDAMGRPFRFGRFDKRA